MKASIEVQFRILSGDKVYTATDLFRDVELVKPKIGRDAWYAFSMEFREAMSLRVWVLLAEVAMKLFDHEVQS